jgi:hypothetical protein
MRAYAIALYIDASGRRSATRSESFEDAMLSLKFDKSLRLAVTRKVSPGHFANGMKRCLERYLSDDVEGDVALRRLVKTLKNSGPYEKGQFLSLSCSPEGAMVVAIDDRVVDTIVSKSLCLALFEAYCGANPVSPRAKRSFEQAWTQLSQS